MSPTRRNFLLGAAAVAALPRTSLGVNDSAASSPFWFDKPATRWLQALPVGNGRMGAIVFGDPAQERLHLSESTLWSGAPGSGSVHPDAPQQVPIIRQHLFAGRYEEAQELVRKYLLGHSTEFGTSLPLGYLALDARLSGAATEYRRWLDLDSGIAHVTFRSGGIRYTREVFASNPDGVVAVRLTCDKPGALSCSISLAEPHLPGNLRTENGNTLFFTGTAVEKVHSDGEHGVEFASRVRVIAEGGHIASASAVINVQGANAVTIYIAIATNYRGADPAGACAATLASALRKSYTALREAHMADHAKLYRRVSLDLGSRPGASDIPMDERRKRLAAGADDPELCTLFFQFGRYLTIAGSRENSPLPLALQGIWNDGRAAAMGWSDDFHMDINTQQNYWVCEVGNLPECHAPLFGFVEALRPNGSKIARDLYNAPGWICHTIVNAWGYTAPGGGVGWGNFPTAGVWISLQLWDHYRFTGDTEFLRTQAYPVLRAAAEFFLAYMVEHPKRGWLVTGPSESPENWFLAPGTKKASSDSMGPTCDRALVYGLLAACIESSTILGIDTEMRARLFAARDKLAPYQIGRYGQLQEWLEDFEEAYPNHRHTSHLIGLYPENQIDPIQTPKLAAAARTTLQRRSSQKDWEDTEWSRANFVNFYARLHDGDEAHRQLLGLLASATDDGLLTYSRGGVAGATDNIFAIDGNTAGAAGLAEMLVQSQNEGLHLLPALPSAWPQGSVRGLRARGGIEVTLHWSGGRLTGGLLKSDTDAVRTVRYGDKTASVHLRRGRAVRIAPSLFSKATL